MQVSNFDSWGHVYMYVHSGLNEEFCAVLNIFQS